MTGKLIGLVGYKGAGKSTLAQTAILNPKISMRALPIYQTSFMAPVYDMLAATGVPSDILYNKARWDEPVDILCGRCVRYAFETLGTEWGVDHIGKDIWIKIALTQCAKVIAQDTSALIDGVRTPAEFDAMRNLGAVMIAVTRPNLIVDLSHSSERHIAGLQRRCDERLENLDGGFNEAATNLRDMLTRIIG